ncbi:MAG: Wzz/FepE/Etk N-terminal domain-containing protein [Verrucomicrobiota bacterium]
MNPKKAAADSGDGIALGDIYFMLFRHKWMIVTMAALGFVGAVYIFLTTPPLYQSEAKLYIRYVVEGKIPMTPVGGDEITRSPEEGPLSIVNTEAEILRSSDLARMVVTNLGASRILGKPVPPGVNSEDAATAMIVQNLTVEPPPRGGVILITFRHPDPQVARDVLTQTIAGYFRKHKEMHQPAGAYGDFVSQEVARVREQLTQTEKELRLAKASAGVTTSVDDTKREYADQIFKMREDLFTARAELAQHQALLGEMPVTSAETTNTPAPIPSEVVNDYTNICGRIEALRRIEQDRLTQYKEGSTMITEIRDQIKEAKKHRQKLEDDYPRLATMLVVLPSPSSAPGGSIDLAAEAMQARGLKSKIAELTAQLAQIQADAAKLEEQEGPIRELERKKDRYEADLKYFASSLEQAQIDEKLGVGKAPNIGVVDMPIPAFKARPKTFKKKVLMVGLGGVLGGLGLALAYELFIDRSVKRGAEVQKKLKLPLVISVPDIRKRRKKSPEAIAPVSRQIPFANGGAENRGGAIELASAARPNAALFRYFEGLRDRLIVYFEVHNFVHKPKLVAVTSCGHGAGVSTLASGLASSLSKTGEGNVLLVDMNADQHGSAQSFHDGKAGSALEAVLDGGSQGQAQVDVNLHLPAGVADGRLSPLWTKRFTQLMPKLRASEYDYIIFDMPPVSHTSITPRLSGLMDMVLLVVEAEKTSRDLVDQANTLLNESKANTSVVLNKTRSYVPGFLQQELQNDE